MIQNLLARLRRQRPSNAGREIAGSSGRSGAGHPAGADQPQIAPQDAGWADLVSHDGLTKYGRGHLMIWPEPPNRATDNRLRAELQSFVVEAEPPIHTGLAVRPEKDPDTYPATSRSFEVMEHGAVVGLFWDDDELPASLRELGGN
jgi:hypothetical protein